MRRAISIVDNRRTSGNWRMAGPHSRQRGSSEMKSGAPQIPSALQEAKPRERLTAFRQMQRLDPLKARLRDVARKSAIFILSQRAKIPHSRKGVSFPLYHHVFDDERKDFERHLKFFRNHGDFVSLDDAIKLLADPAGL